MAETFIDILGASGRAYRFRQFGPFAVAPGRAGNFVCVKMQATEFTMVCAGEADDLAQSSALWSGVNSTYGETDLYVRLNVTRAARNAEHSDIVARHQPLLTAPSGLAGA